MTLDSPDGEAPDDPPGPHEAAEEDLRWLGEPPPQGAPWDLPVRHTPWVFLDCEMTGIDPARDAVIEIAARRMRGDAEEGSLDTLVRAEVPSAPAALAAHGIDHALLSDAPPLHAVLPALEALLVGAVPVLHGAALDRVFLNRAFEAHGSSARIHQVIDTVLLARRAVLAKSYRLAAVCDHLGVPPRRWHRAREDVLAVQEVFLRVSSLLRPESARDLWQVRAGVRAPTVVRDAVARTLAGAGNRPLAVLVRQPGRTPKRVVGRLIRWETPHLTLGLGASGRYRGVSILRADRVLSVEVLAPGSS
ncbi:MAG: 3'-5' exonuclease [Polyangiales bacterium]